MTLCSRQHCRTRAPSHFYPPPQGWGGQGEWAGRPCKGAPAVPPSFITPIKAPPLPPVSPTRKVAASPWRLRLRLQQPRGPQTLPKVWQGWEDGPSMGCQETSGAGPTPSPGREVPLIAAPSSHPLRLSPSHLEGPTDSLETPAGTASTLRTELALPVSGPSAPIPGPSRRQQVPACPGGRRSGRPPPQGQRATEAKSRPRRDPGTRGLGGPGTSPSRPARHRCRTQLVPAAPGSVACRLPSGKRSSLR